MEEEEILLKRIDLRMLIMKKLISHPYKDDIHLNVGQKQ